MTTREPGRRSGRAVRRCAPVKVCDDERQHLIEVCAFFRADRFREAAPGTIRESDRTAAAADLHKVIGRPRTSGGHR